MKMKMKMLMNMLINIISYLIAICIVACIAVCFTAGYFYIIGYRSERDLIMAGLFGVLLFIVTLIIYLIIEFIGKLLKRPTKTD